MPRCSNCGYDGQDAFSFCPRCGAPAADAAEQRKRVTVLFCDVIASTALGERIDPETLRRVLSRYFETSKQVVEHHGGTLRATNNPAGGATFTVTLPVVAGGALATVDSR